MVYTKTEIKGAYSKVANIYDIWGVFTESESTRRVLDIAGIKDGETVLEVAVGTGKVFESIAQMNKKGKNFGIDISEDMLAKARARLYKYKNCTLELGDAYNMTFADNTFDVIINNYMFDLLPEKDFIKVLQEFNRVLKPKGRMVITTMTLGKRWYNKIWNFISRKIPSILVGCRPVDLEKAVKKVSFNFMRVEYVSQNTFPSKIIFAEK